MKIAIIGAGAMGSIYAGLLADNGKHDVWAIDTWAAHVDAINANGLRVEGKSGDRTVRVNATTEAGDVRDADLVIIATKDDGCVAAAKAALAVAKAEAPILTIQNGLGSADKVAAVIGSKRIMMGVVGGFGASMLGPGHAHHNGMEFVRLGEMDGHRAAHHAEPDEGDGGHDCAPWLCLRSAPVAVNAAFLRSGQRHSRISPQHVEVFGGGAGESGG